MHVAAAHDVDAWTMLQTAMAETRLLRLQDVIAQDAFLHQDGSGGAAAPDRRRSASEHCGAADARTCPGRGPHRHVQS